jgi:hypothetical protein
MATLGDGIRFASSVTSMMLYDESAVSVVSNIVILPYCVGAESKVFVVSSKVG